MNYGDISPDKNNHPAKGRLIRTARTLKMG
jgi:hypothetical protein